METVVAVTAKQAAYRAKQVEIRTLRAQIKTKREDLAELEGRMFPLLSESRKLEIEILTDLAGGEIVGPFS